MKTVEKSQNPIPKLRYHKASGRAYVVLNTRAIWLGKSGSEEAEQNYNKVIAEWLSSGRQIAADGSNITLDEILGRFWVYAEGYYRSPEGKPTTELDSLRYAFRPLSSLYGNTEAHAERLAKLHANRKTPLSCGNVPGSCRKEDPKWNLGACYDGHTRYKAAQQLGIEKVPVHVARDLTSTQIKAYRIADME